MDGTLNRVGVAPTGVTAVHPQAGTTFTGGLTTTYPVARNQSPTSRTRVERWIWLGRLKIRPPTDWEAPTEAAKSTAPWRPRPTPPSLALPTLTRRRQQQSHRKPWPSRPSSHVHRRCRNLATRACNRRRGPTMRAGIAAVRPLSLANAEGAEATWGPAKSPRRHHHRELCEHPVG